MQFVFRSVLVHIISTKAIGTLETSASRVSVTGVGITLDSADEPRNASESVRAKREFESNAIDEGSH
jgi:hypothetical protein